MKTDSAGLANGAQLAGRGRVWWGMRRALVGLAGARLCYGEAVHAGDRVVIPVARVHAIGGFGGGEGISGDDVGGGGGGGGFLDAAPIGYIEATPEGSRFVSISDPAGTALALRNAAGAVAILASAAVTFRRRQRAALPPPRRLLRR
jgi:uncharacterized spore protein YtfJ